MLKKLLASSLFSFIALFTAYAQVGQGALKGKVTDKESKMPLPFVNVVVEQNGTVITGAASDFDGEFTIKPIPPGKFDIKASFTGYQPVQISGVVINAEKITFQNIAMTTTAIDIKEFEVIDYAVPLISKDNTTTGGTLTREDIDKLPGRSATSVAQTVGGVYSQDDGRGALNIRGGREDANYYFIDGIKVRGSNNVPKASIEQVTVITGGVPAQYGDITGGIISITTRGASKEYQGSVDYSTSGYKIGDKMYGLDAYGFNLLEGSVSGPLWWKKDTAGNKTEPLLGFFLSGNFSSMIDENPSAIGWWKVKDDMLNNLIANPLRQVPGSPGTYLNHEFIRMSDLEKVKTKKNAAENGFTLAGKIDVNTGKNTNLTFGGNLDFNKSRQYQYRSEFLENSLMNWENSPLSIDRTWRVYTRFTQRFGSGDANQEEKSASTIKNAFYSIQMDYNKEKESYQDNTHKDDLFKYGYAGKFKTYSTRYYEVDPSYNNGSGAFVQRAFRDTLIGFEVSDVNYEMARYTQSYYNLFGWEGYDENGNPKYDFSKADPLAGTGTTTGGFWLNSANNGVSPEFTGDREGFFDDMVRVQQFGGLRNGDQPRNIYNLWRSSGYQYDNYQITNNGQFRINATGSADIKDHAISIGFEYEQRVDRGYNIDPVELWTLGRLKTNAHLANLDTAHPSVINAGMQLPVVNFERQNASPGDYDATRPGGEAQSFFDYNLRKKLEFDPDGNQWIDFDSYDPSTFSIDMFSADELSNYFKSGNNVSRYNYYGYSHDGKLVKKNPSFEDFFTERDEYGNFTRPEGAFRPVYVAGYIQDKFSFDDLIFNIGARIDRYDANQKVLKDPYSLFPTVKAGEDLTKYGILEYTIPSNIGKEYVVYTDNVANPTKIVGFRNSDTWYNAEGTEIAGGSSLRTGGEVHPLLVDNKKTASKDITSEAFQDYKPQTNFMPRIAFSFPISDEALFFAHYDVLTKRPTQGPYASPINRLNLLDYYYLEAVGYVINNPNLKPEKTIDYEVGFQQKLNNASSLKFSAFYRELRNMVQVVNVVDAYPRKYQTFGNIDFGTIKGITVSYDLRRTANLQMKASYTLQFAEGTGSDAQSGLNLARADKQNIRTSNPFGYDQRHAIVNTIDYRYGEGADYNGPVLFGKQIFANTGANFVFSAGSGTPYSRKGNIVDDAHIIGAVGSILSGQINGSRLPWQFRADARIDKDIQLRWNIKGEGEEKNEKTTDLNIYLQVLNLFNTKNIIDVWGATGNPDDDGYLGAAKFQTNIQQQNDEQSYREFYNAKVNTPYNYSLPRRIRLGLLLNF